MQCTDLDILSTHTHSPSITMAKHASLYHSRSHRPPLPDPIRTPTPQPLTTEHPFGLANSKCPMPSAQHRLTSHTTSHPSAASLTVSPPRLDSAAAPPTKAPSLRTAPSKQIQRPRKRSATQPNPSHTAKKKNLHPPFLCRIVPPSGRHIHTHCGSPSARHSRFPKGRRRRRRDSPKGGCQASRTRRSGIEGARDARVQMSVSHHETIVRAGCARAFV